PGGGFNDCLQITGQGFVGVLVDRKLEDRARLVPARIVVVLAYLVKTEGEIVVGPDPVGGIDDVGLQRGVELSAGDIDGLGPEPADHFAADAGDADLQAPEVLDAVDLPVEPAGHLHTGTAPGEGDQVERGIDFPPQ